jgi:hypothetical protein
MVSQLAHRIANPDRFAARLANDFAIRCIQIAKASHLDGTARLVSLRTATIEFVVPSRNRSAQHTVICDFCGSMQYMVRLPIWGKVQPGLLARGRSHPLFAHDRESLHVVCGEHRGLWSESWAR